MAASDEALLAELAAGNRDASAAFVRRFQRRVYGLARTTAPVQLRRDSGPSTVTGKGLTATFDGVELTWHVATP